MSVPSAAETVKPVVGPFAAQIVEYLNALGKWKWTLREYTPGQWLNQGRDFQHIDCDAGGGVEVTVCGHVQGRQTTWRVELSPLGVRASDGYRFDIDCDKATVSAARGPGALLSAFASRFWPKFRDAMTEAHAKAAEHEAMIKRVKARQAAIAGILGEEKPQAEYNLSVLDTDCAYGTIDCRGEEAHFKLRSVPPDMANELTAVIVRWRAYYAREKAAKKSPAGV